MLTIREIARRSNVTPGLVSLVLNGKGKASPATRDRIEAIVAEFGYQPRGVGRPRRASQDQTRSISVIYAQRVANGGQLSKLSQEWIGGIRDVAISNGIHLNVIGGFADATQDEMFRHALESGHVDGVVLIGITASDGASYLSLSSKHRLPTVVMNRTPAHGEFSYVSMDNYGAGRIAISHLAELGHRKIAVIHPIANESYAADRHAGFEAGFKASGLAASVSIMVPAAGESETLRRACSQVVESGSTAVYMTAGDELASRCVDIWNDMGVKVPDDLSVIGWDDVGPVAKCGIRPSSIGYDKAGMGREAATMLMDLMRRGESIQSRGVVVPTRVVDHGSIGPVSHSNSKEGLVRTGAN